MTALAHRPAAFEIRSFGEPCARDARAQRLWLRPTDDGWSLISPAGDLVFRAQGTRARRACLEFAREHGFAAVFS
ncbi:MAG TPA: hypothetical protein VE992_04070 [Solirubrobacteraceae bacterium]|nr:hypothetical protein [Solirubrobacteraceae bacterium]